MKTGAPGQIASFRSGGRAKYRPRRLTPQGQNRAECPGTSPAAAMYLPGSCGRSVTQALAQEISKRHARVARGNNCVLRPELKPSNKGRRWDRAIRECRDRRDARLERGSRGHPCRPSHRARHFGIHGPARRPVGCNDGGHHRLLSPRGNRLRRRVVSSASATYGSRPVPGKWAGGMWVSVFCSIFALPGARSGTPNL
jgi:hypothetical protein